MPNYLQDIRFGVRQLLKNRGFTITAAATLALGIGATVGIFSVVYSVLLEPLPFPQQHRLVWLQQLDRPSGTTGKIKGGIPEPFSYPDYFDIRNQMKSGADVASYHSSSYILAGSGEPENLEGQVVSFNFFRVLGVRPFLGREFAAADEKPGANLAILSHELWQRKFAASRGIIGRSIDLGDRQYTVVGVMSAGFAYPIQNPAPALWTTLADDTEGSSPATSQRGDDMLNVIGRLKPNVSVTQARSNLDLIVHRMMAAYPSTNGLHNETVLRPLLEHLTGDTRPAFNLLSSAVLLFLLIACVNVAGLLLARATRRWPEMALRLSLGASRAAVMRQMLVESVLLSCSGGLLGVWLAEGFVQVLLNFAPQLFPRLQQASINGPVLLFALAISILTGLLFGMLPAFRVSQIDPALALREGSRNMSGTRGQHRLHSYLVVAETAIGLILLVASGLLIHSFVRTLQVNPGFNTKNVLTGSLGIPPNRYPNGKRVQLYRELFSRIAALPGVQEVAAGWPLPLSGSKAEVTFEIEGRPTPPGQSPYEALNIVTPGFFHTLRIPLTSGRDFQATDNDKSAPVLIVNQKFARKYFGGQSAIGKRVRIDVGDDVMNHPMREIVGVVGDLKRTGLTAETDTQYYLPFAQSVIVSPTLCVRASGNPTPLIQSIRKQLAALDPGIPVYQLRTLDDIVTLASSRPRFQTMLLTFFAAMAVLLSSIGLYASLSYMVAQRTTELGLRMALGAQRENVLALVVRRALTLALMGLFIGILLSALLTRFMAGMLYRTRPLDFWALSGAVLIFLAVTMIASIIPALRAAYLDPIEALRQQ
ncbi:MAG TPA: ABC transporter permease [Bryobacteraceae bacterium]|nr:ABC transporter permease [Bryobacteraceae bacterium]